MRALVLAVVSVLSWLGGGVAYRAALYWGWGERPSPGGFSAVNFWTLLLFLCLVPFHIRSVSMLTRPHLNSASNMIAK